MPLGHRALINRLRERLPRLRQQLGLSQDEVALRARISLRYYQGLENGEDLNPTLKVLAGLAKAFGVEFWELFSEASSHLSDS